MTDCTDRPEPPTPLPPGMHDFKLRDAWSAQGAVGYEQVERKRADLRRLIRQPTKFLGDILRKPIVVILGPPKPENEETAENAQKEKRPGRKKKDTAPDQAAGEETRDYGIYVIDHNHLGRAMIEEDFIEAPMIVCQDWRDMQDYGAFLERMEREGFLRARDEDGNPIPREAVIRKIADLPDDPYRSLASAARQEGAFDKSAKPFAEFEWADFFRARIPKQDLKKDFEKATKAAVKLASKPEAAGMPGYKGPGPG